MKKEPIGHQSTVLGDFGTPLIPVYELNLHEQLTRDLISTTKLRLREFDNRRKLLPTEIGRKAELEAVMKELKDNCEHRVFRDEDGFIYYSRYCCTCNAYLGSI